MLNISERRTWVMDCGDACQRSSYKILRHINESFEQRRDNNWPLMSAEDGLPGAHDPAGREAGGVDARDKLPEKRSERAKPVHRGPGIVRTRQHLLGGDGSGPDARDRAPAAEQQLLHQEKGRPVLHTVHPPPFSAMHTTSLLSFL